MAFTFSDALEVLQAKEDGTGVETFHLKHDRVQAVTPSEIKGMFPGIKFTESEHIAYVPFKMCHSLPTINARGRCFTAKTLANSFASAKDGLINMEHMLRHNGMGREDKIIGHICASAFPHDAREVANNAEKALPVYALGALYLRSPEVKSMIHEHQSGARTWRTSMECGHNWKNAALLYRGEMIPMPEADGRMLECIQVDHIKPYDGHEIAAVLGGPDGWVDFWGLAMTVCPADSGADVLGIYSGRSLELASKHKILYAPMFMKNFGHSEKSLEVASKAVDTLIKERASITVIGETEPAEDGHRHMILSDMTILPSMGHGHYLGSRSLDRGSDPKLTGYTEQHYEYYEDGTGERRERIHAHLVNISLRGKYSPPNADVDLPESASLPSPLTVNDKEHPMWKELLTRLEAIEKKVSSGNEKTENSVILTEIAAVKKFVEDADKEKATAEAIEEEVKKRLESGDFVAKADHEKAVADAAKEAEAKIEEERKRAAAIEARIASLKESGVDLTLVYDEVEVDGKPQTIEDHIRSIEVDEKGDVEFRRMATLLKAAAKGAAQSQQVEEQHAEAASKPANKPKHRSILNPVGSPTGDEGEEGEVASSQPAASKSIGRDRFKRFSKSV